MNIWIDKTFIYIFYRFRLFYRLVEAILISVYLNWLMAWRFLISKSFIVYNFFSLNYQFEGFTNCCRILLLSISLLVLSIRIIDYYISYVTDWREVTFAWIDKNFNLYFFTSCIHFHSIGSQVLFNFNYQHCQIRHIETIENFLKQCNKLEKFKNSCVRYFLDFSQDMMFFS